MTSKTPYRGATLNTPNRFESAHLEPLDASETGLIVLKDGIEHEEERPLARTQFFKDHSRSAVTQNDSPDIGFRYSVNPYRGCEHGCAYCYARPTHEYLGMSAGIEFESKIIVKENAPELLRKKLISPKWVPELIFMSGITDCYQPIERKLQITRRCLEVFLEFRNPVFLITKNHLITRDIDLLKELAAFKAVGVFLSVTTLDADLCGILEPRTSRPSFRLKAIEALAKAGIPVGVNVAPVIPGLTDHELPSILKAAAEAGATQAGFTPVRLPHSVLPIFTQCLETHKPERKDKVLNRIRDLRGGKLNDPNFGSRMRGQGEWAENLRKMFKIYSKKLGLNDKDMDLSTAHFSRPNSQMQLL